MNAGRASTFVTTRWTQVLAAQGNSPQAQQALSDLCAAYYAPVIAFLRRSGRDEDAARELAHEFFARVLEQQSLGGANPERGRFRSYLLGALKHFLANRRAHDLREKRGGRVIHESISGDADPAAGAVMGELMEPVAEKLFDREWALSVLDRALAALRQQANEDNTLREFEVLKPWLTGEDTTRSQAEAARDLGISDGAVRVAIHRLRRRFRDRVNAEVLQTVQNPTEVAAEIRHLINSVSEGGTQMGAA